MPSGAVHGVPRLEDVQRRRVPVDGEHVGAQVSLLGYGRGCRPTEKITALPSWLVVNGSEPLRSRVSGLAMTLVFHAASESATTIRQ
jgi:hypothetical protein